MGIIKKFAWVGQCVFALFVGVILSWLSAETLKAQFNLHSCAIISVLVLALTRIYFSLHSNTKCPFVATCEKPPEPTVVLPFHEILGQNLARCLIEAHEPLKSESLTTKLNRVLGEWSWSHTTGVIFVHNNCDFAGYAGVAGILDSVAAKSIESTNLPLPSELLKRDHADRIRGHLSTVNSKTRLERTRVQILRRNQDSGPTNLHTAISLQQDLQTDSQLAEDWTTLFKAESSGVRYYETTYEDSLPADFFFGDYIVYDRQTVLLYDYESRILSLFIGRNLIDRFARVFQVQGCDSEASR